MWTSLRQVRYCRLDLFSKHLIGYIWLKMNYNKIRIFWSRTTVLKSKFQAILYIFFLSFSLFLRLKIETSCLCWPAGRRWNGCMAQRWRYSTIWWRSSRSSSSLGNRAQCCQTKEDNKSNNFATIARSQQDLGMPSDFCLVLLK